MARNTHYLIEVRRLDGAEVVGLHTDDLSQALRRAERMWQTGLYDEVAVGECRWNLGGGRWMPTGQRVRTWRDAARAAA